MRYGVSRTRQSQGAGERRGQVLLEFAVVSFLLTFLLAAMVTFGFLFFGANVVQQAADVGAMELSRHPFRADGTFDDALVDSGLFDESQLVVPVGTDQNSLALINRQLFPLYIYDPDIDSLRYPGALAEKDGAPTVLIPVLAAPTSATDPQTIGEWRRVVEEVTPSSEVNGPYAVSSTTTGGLLAGTVVLRINYPFQSGAMIAYRQSDSAGNAIPITEAVGQDEISNVFVAASDTTVSNASLPDGYTLAPPAPNPQFGAGVHRGQYGMGELQAFGTLVRPYRKVISAQGIYRREVFE